MAQAILFRVSCFFPTFVMAWTRNTHATHQRYSVQCLLRVALMKPSTNNHVAALALTVQGSPFPHSSLTTSVLQLSLLVSLSFPLRLTHDESKQ